MSRDELLLFKAFGSAASEGERPFVLFHSAFELGQGAAGAPPPPPRKSLEVRCVAIWDE